MRALTVTSPKGGVGKTTVALNLAYSLARRGWRTLIVDADPAGAIGLSLTKKVAQAPGLAEYASGRAGLAHLLVETRLPGLSLLPAGQVAPDDATGFGAVLDDGSLLHRLRREVEGRADLVLFDTPAGFGGATLGALRASEWALCPVQAEPIAARSVLRIFDVLATLKEQGARVELLGVLLTMLQTKNASSLAVAEDLWRTLPNHVLFETTIPRDTAFLDASAAGVPVGLLRRRPPPVALTFDQLAAEVEARTRLSPKEAHDEPIALVD